MGHSYGTDCPWEGTDHPGAPQPPLTILVLSDECFWNGTGPIDPGGDNGGGGIGDPDDPNDPIDDLGGGLTSPILTIETKDCTELKKNSDDVIFKQQMQALDNNILGTAEKGFGIYNGSLIDPPFPNPSSGVILTGTAKHGPPIPFFPNQKAIAHNHLKDPQYEHIGIFTQDDLVALSNLAIELEEANSLVQKHELATYVVCDEGNYSLKVNNIDKLYNFVVKYGTDVEFRDRVDRFYEDNNLAHGKPKKDQNIGFLKLIQKFDIGTTLYEADENFENWEQLKLNDSGNDITKKPC